MGILDLPIFLTLVAIAVGATIGSFLNVVIYRVPRDLSVNDPKRSFCPSCNYLIPFYHNIPLISWLALRGKCKNCGEKISMRYWLVELMTAALFVAIWLKFGWHFEENVFAYPELVPVGWLLLAMFVSATFIDIEHQIIPDSITIGGTIIGLLLAFLVPVMAPEFMACPVNCSEGGWVPRLHSFGWSAAGAATGFGLLYGVQVLGKLAFGKKDLKMPEDAEWSLSQAEEEPEPMFRVGDQGKAWDEVYFVGSECLELHSEQVEINRKVDGKVVSQTYKDVPVRMWFDKISIDGEESGLEDVKSISGKLVGGVRYLREAMGFGDVKFMAMVGAFLGWKAVLFTVLVASVAGTAVALPARILGKGDSAFARIPFGPYLAFGATVWLFFGSKLVTWYFDLMRMNATGY